MTTSRTNRSRPYDKVKRVLDVAAAATLLVVTSPVQAAVAGLVRLRMGSPVLFKQPRPGRDGKVFTLYKFRSMLPEDPERGLTEAADRLTPFGRGLRSSSLDELPSLWNVLRGDMSMVGPRPLLVEYLPLYSPDFDADYPPEALELKAAIEQSDAILFVTPEYNRSIPGALKNAIDWASRPWGKNSFHHIPAGVIGASPGAIGTAVGQQSLRAVLGFCNARQMTSPEAYIHYRPDVFSPDGEVSNDETAAFLSAYLTEFRDHIARVLTVLPRPS